MRTPADDYYARLGVAPTAGVGELRRAFRLLALRFHPDRAGAGSTESFQRISEAYQVLSNAAARASYDGWRRQQAERAAGGSPAETPSTVRRRSPAPPPHPPLARLCGSLEALLARHAARRAADGTIELLLTRGEASAGGVAAIEMPAPVTCPTCGGVAAHDRVWCARCQYAGTVVEEVATVVDIPPQVADRTMFVFHADPSGMAPPLRVRLRIEG